MLEEERHSNEVVMMSTLIVGTCKAWGMTMVAKTAREVSKEGDSG